MEMGEKVDLFLEVGPHPLAPYGTLKLTLGIKGEKVECVDVVVGYVHRGIEKLCENRKYLQLLPILGKIDHLSACSYELGFVLAVEKLLGIKNEIPERANYIRVILAELSRIVSHLTWLGTSAVEFGMEKVCLLAFEDRERIMKLFEQLSGTQSYAGFIKIGGVSQDFSEKFLQELADFVDEFFEKISKYEELLTENRVWKLRTVGVGIIDKDTAISWGITGPVLRAAGCDYDVRKYYPYCVYDKLEFNVPVYHNGDVYDRYRVRIDEMKESLKIIKQCIENLPEGNIIINNFKFVLPKKDEIYETLTNLIKHFYLTVHGIKPPPGEVYQAVEGPRGELGYYIVSNGTDKPYRVRIRTPSFTNLSILPEILKGYFLDDVVPILNSLDPLMGEVDR
jgi:NADH-quinone oxidoreductase subunit D